MSDFVHRARQIIAEEIEGLMQIMRNVDDTFNSAVHLICGCSGKVIVTGVGKSGLVGRKICATFSSTGTPSLFMNPLDALHGDLGVVQRGDIALVISYSGNTREIVDICRAFRAAMVPVIALTSNYESRLAKLSDIRLNISIHREACQHGLVPTTSSTATLALGDALALCVSSLRCFDLKQLSVIHPHGAIGAALGQRKEIDCTLDHNSAYVEKERI